MCICLYTPLDQEVFKTIGSKNAQLSKHLVVVYTFLDFLKFGQEERLCDILYMLTRFLKCLGSVFL